jgi:methionyl-tRNA formyltransferase
VEGEEEIRAHFDRLARTEGEFFAAADWNGFSMPVETVARGQLNTPAIVEKVRTARPDAIAVFGCGIIKGDLLSAVPPGRMLNIHQGLSPYYRGSGTNFWPFVEGRLEYVGVTVHTIDPGVDTGGVIAHGRPKVQPADTQHMIGCRTIEVSADILCQAFGFVARNEALLPIEQWPGGRVYKRADFNVHVLRKSREMEAAGFVQEWCRRRDAGLVEPVRLITFE